MNYIIKNYKLFLSDRYGNTGRQISENVQFATWSESQRIFLVTQSDGRVITKDNNGNSIRRICDGAIEAKFEGENILVRTRNGNQLLDKYGNLIRRM